MKDWVAMMKLLMTAALLVAIGSVTPEGAYAKGSSLGQTGDLFDVLTTSKSKSRNKAKEASSTNDRKRSKRNKK